MRISQEIRRYVLGLLYLMMAALIINAVSYMATMIPEVSISPSGASVKTSTQYEPAQLVVVKSAQDENKTLVGSSQIYYKNINLNLPGAGRAWLIVFPTPGANITVYVSGFTAKHTNAQGNTYILSKDKITEISIYLSTQTPPVIPLRIYSVDEKIPIPPPTDYLNPPPPQGSASPTVEISNKTIIMFVGWSVGIILAVIGLSKFNISI